MSNFCRHKHSQRYYSMIWDNNPTLQLIVSDHYSSRSQMLFIINTQLSRSWCHRITTGITFHCMKLHYHITMRPWVQLQEVGNWPATTKADGQCWLADGMTSNEVARLKWEAGSGRPSIAQWGCGVNPTSFTLFGHMLQRHFLGPVLALERYFQNYWLNCTKVPENLFNTP